MRLAPSPRIADVTMPPRIFTARRSRAVRRVAVLATVALLAVLAAHRAGLRLVGIGDDPPIARTSWAVGFSTGIGLRDAMALSADEFRQGLVDGLGGEATQARVLTRPELFAAMRDVTKRLTEAELAAVSARIDEEQDR